MTDATIVALIVAIPPTLAAVTALIVSLRNNSLAIENKAAVKEVHLSINSRLDEMLQLSKAAGIQEGRLYEGSARDKTAAAAAAAAAAALPADGIKESLP